MLFLPLARLLLSYGNPENVFHQFEIDNCCSIIAKIWAATRPPIARLIDSRMNVCSRIVAVLGDISITMRACLPFAFKKINQSFFIFRTVFFMPSNKCIYVVYLFEKFWYQHLIYYLLKIRRLKRTKREFRC